MIRFTEVSLWYENKQALDQINLTVSSAHITGIAGPNGAGKSSLMRVGLGLIREFSGEVTIDNHSVKKERQYIKNQCTYAPEETSLFPYLTGNEFLQLMAVLRQVPKEKIASTIRFFTDLLEMSDFTEKLIVDYSHGMRQKMLLAAALLGDPSYIFIDEALNGLDAPALYRLKKYLRSLAQKGRTVLIASHNLSLIREWCDSLVILNEGKLLVHWKKQELEKHCALSGKSFEEIFLQLIGSE